LVSVLFTFDSKEIQAVVNIVVVVGSFLSTKIESAPHLQGLAPGAQRAHIATLLAEYRTPWNE
jgi:hypothetical protein